jgi:hypothetical protein
MVLFSGDLLATRRDLTKVRSAPDRELDEFAPSLNL